MIRFIFTALILVIFYIPAHPQERTGRNPADNLPLHISRITEFGQRPDWSHDGKRLLFIEKTYGDAYEVEIATRKITPVTHHFFHGGFTRALYLANGDILLSGSRRFDSQDPHVNRYQYAELWVLDKNLTKPPVPLNTFCYEGPAVSRKNMKIAWCITDMQYPELKEGQILMYEADIVYQDGEPILTNKREILDNLSFDFKIKPEPQNFIPPKEEKVTFTSAYHMGTDVLTLDINTGEIENMVNQDIQYDEPEGIFPSGEYTLVESDKHNWLHVRYLDIYKLWLDGTGRMERLTRWNKDSVHKATNPVVSDDGKYMAFQLARATDKAGIGRGLFVFDFDLYESTKGEGKWQTLGYRGEPQARHENAFVEVDGNFYLLGGRGIKPVDIYDPETRHWTTGAEPPVELHHFQAVVYDQKIYIIGAMTGKFPNETPLEYIMIYDPVNDKWLKGAEIPADRRRGSAGVVVDGNKAIIISGIQNGHVGGHVPWVDQYNFETGEWRKLADAPRPRDHFHAAQYQGKIYCAGGRNTDYAAAKTFAVTIPEVDVYDIQTNSWQTLPEPQNLPTERAGTSAVMLGDDLIIIGGESGNQKNAHDEVEAYNLTTRTWRKLSHLDRGRHGTQAILHDAKIFIMAGSGNRGGSPELNTIEMFYY